MEKEAKNTLSPKTDRSNDVFFPAVGVGYQRLALDDVLAIIANKGIVEIHFHSRNKKVVSWLRLNTFRVILDDRFIQVSRSAYVNTEKIEIIRGDDVSLINGLVITISREARKALLEKFMIIR